MVSANGSANPYYLLDPYRDFLKEEGVPVHEEYAVDCNTLPVEPWERLGGKGAYIHLAGRGDYLSCYLAEIPPGGQLNVERHLHEESVYVISGRGATSVEVPGQGKQHLRVESRGNLRDSSELNSSALQRFRHGAGPHCGSHQPRPDAEPLSRRRLHLQKPVCL